MNLLLLYERFIINIPVFELQYILETLHVPVETQRNTTKECAYKSTHIRIIRLHVCMHTDQLWTRCTEGVLRRLSGSKSISFIIFASLTGSSCLRNVNDVFAHAFSEPAETKMHKEQKAMTTSSHLLLH